MTNDFRDFQGMTFVVGPDNSIMHHGRIGQKWGDRNGPPYPLSRRALKDAGYRLTRKEYKQYVAEEKLKNEAVKREKMLEARIAANKQDESYEENKARALKYGTASDITRYMGDLTNDEFEKALARLNWEAKLTAKADAERNEAWDAVNGVAKKAGDVDKWIQAVKNLIDDTGKLRETFAKATKKKKTTTTTPSKKEG